MTTFKVSQLLNQLTTPYPLPNDLLAVLKCATAAELCSFVQLWWSEGIPHAFKNCPALYESIRCWLGATIGVHPKLITLIGSSRLGYSLAPGPSYGNPFNAGSDLDFSVVSSSLFDHCSNTFKAWKEDYQAGIVKPSNAMEEKYWGWNVAEVPRSLGRGFIDPWKIPLRPQYKIAQQLKQAMWGVTVLLQPSSSNIQVKKASIRVFRDWHAFVSQHSINLRQTALKTSHSADQTLPL